MITKIVTISSLEMQGTMAGSLHYDELSNAGFEFEFWNVCRIMYNKKVSQGISIDTSKEVDIYSISDLINNISRLNLDKTLFIMFVGYEKRSREIFNKLKDYRCITAYLDNMTWWDSQDLSFLNKLLAYLQHPQKMIEKIIQKLKHEQFDYINANFDIIIYESAYRKPKSGIPVSVNSVLYEEAQSTTVPRCFDNVSPYIVYHDTAFGHHPDFKLTTDDIPDIAQFYEEILLFFDKLENDLKMPIIIAAHPKSHYKGHEFNGRKIYKNMTCSLVSGARMSLSDGSLSTLFAVCLKKPIIFFDIPESKRYFKKISFQNFSNSYRSQIKKLCSQKLNMPYIDYSPGYNKKIEIPTIDDALYEDEIYRWLAHKGKENVPSSKILKDFLSGFDISAYRKSKMRSS